ncbi:EAL domain-containing protein [Malaciobacter pacificus]|nr:EAL domain-containing protein [Malaciobacter pacificus]
MTLIIVVVETATLFLVLRIQKEENNKNAIVEAKAITQSLNNDLLKYLLNPSADMLSDINFRLSAFKKINTMILFDENNNPIYKYGDISNISLNESKISKKDIVFTDDDLFIKNRLTAQGYNFGYTLLDIDLTSFKIKQEQITNTIIMIFPFALIFGIFLSLFLSKSYTQPFLNLINSMRKSDPTKDKIVKVKTNANNEIKELFEGFNNLMKQISQSSKQLRFQASHDQLTNIFNRYYLEEKLQEALKSENKNGYSLFNIDLDQFKLINDSAGNQVGDELLKMLVVYFNTILPKNSIFARVDGDSFMVLLDNETIDESKKLLDLSLEKLSDFRFSNQTETFSVSASISLVHFKAYQYTLKELLKASSSALYTAKQKGRNKSHIYDASDENIKRFSIELDTAKYIKEALNDGPSRFELFAQDIVPLQEKSDKIGYEILIRMWDKNNNFISPADFLPAAERYQLMADIDTYVLWTYLETVTKDKDHINKLHSAHINLAGSSLNNIDFQRKVKEAIEHFDFPWEKLELEITESSAIGSFNVANEFISWLKSKNIGLALDDFGTGMASFEYLKNMPFDVVKIDGSFVKDMHVDPTDKAVIKYIQEIASLKNQETVAEYVETKEDVEELTKLGITYGQGYYLGKPRPLSSWLED